MDMPEWLKPGLVGAAAGATALAIVGFSWGGWLTEGSANKMASDIAQAEVVTALVPVCVQLSKMDPLASQTFLKLKEASSYQRRGILMEAGWATMPGSSEANRYVATACLEKLSEEF